MWRARTPPPPRRGGGWAAWRAGPCAALLLTAAAVLVATRTAAASEDEACGASIRAWAAACTAGGEGRVDAFRCPPGHAVLAVALAGRPPVFVDASARGQALRRIGGLGLSPVGEFAEFQDAPVAVREAFARVEACVERDPHLELEENPAGTSGRDGQSGGRGAAVREGMRLPFLLLGAIALATLGLAPRSRPSARTLRTMGLLFALSATTLALAYGIAGASFFHQNGHGPNWIGHALGEPSPYGPGYAETYGWLARLRPDDPEALVFALGAALAAACPAAAWVVARRTGASRALAWAVALALAVDPLLWRMAPTESYYVPCTALPMAAAALVLSAPTLRAWSPRSLLVAGAAALLLAETARVHPVAWVAVAVVPLVPIARRGSPRRNLAHAGIALAVAAGVVAVAAAGAERGVLAGEMGERLQQWRRGGGDELQTAVMVAAAVACVQLPWARGRALPRALLLGIVAGASTLGTSLLQVDVDWLRAAHWHPFLGAFVAAGIGASLRIARTPARGRLLVPVVAAAALANLAVHVQWATRLPTDALELRLALAWRSRLAAGERLVAVGTAGVMSLDLPVYAREAGSDLGTPLVRLEAAGAPPALTSFGDDVLYYRSSLCGTAAARAWCDALEATATLEPLVVADLPARPSTHATTYDGPTVHVGLYRARPRP